MFTLRKLAAVTCLFPIALAACGEDPIEPLGTPGGVQVQALTPTSARVTFNPVSRATGYVVERALTSGGAFVAVGTPDTTVFVDAGLAAGTAYKYRVAATRGSETSGFSSEAQFTTLSAFSAVINADITTNRTLFADSVYTLSGFIHVANGATLTIQPGTKILGDANVLGSSLFIMRGARIVAKGTAQAPIVFTSSRPAGQRQPGDWGGLIIVGNARVNRSGTVNLEGTGTPGNPLIPYSGGTTDTDNSGELEYVRIEFAGFAPAENQELNSLTLAAVGSGTRIQFVQTLAGLDDSFEWFGGTVDGKYLVSYESGDDHFDMSEGFRGRLQFLIALQTRVLTPRAGAGGLSTDPQGIENDGCNGSGCDTGFDSNPLTVPVVANFTLIGRHDAQLSTAANLGMVLRRGTGGFYVNGVLARWASSAISVRDAATQTRVTSGDLTLNNILIADAPFIYQAGQQAGVDPAANALIMPTGTTAGALFTALPAAAATNTSTIDWMPSASSAIRTGGLSAFTGRLLTAAGTFVTPTAYRGAVDPSGPKWWEGWTSYAAN